MVACYPNEVQSSQAEKRTVVDSWCGIYEGAFYRLDQHSPEEFVVIRTGASKAQIFRLDAISGSYISELDTIKLSKSGTLVQLVPRRVSESINVICLIDFKPCQ